MWYCNIYIYKHHNWRIECMYIIYMYKFNFFIINLFLISLVSKRYFHLRLWPGLFQYQTFSTISKTTKRDRLQGFFIYSSYRSIRHVIDVNFRLKYYSQNEMIYFQVSGRAYDFIYTRDFKDIYFGTKKYWVCMRGNF